MPLITKCEMFIEHAYSISCNVIMDTNERTSSLVVPDGENPLQMQPSESESSQPTHKSVIQESRGLDYVSPPKYKSSLLNRYLNDSLRHVMASNTDSRKRNHSGSFSSNEYEDELLSPSLSETEANFTYRTGQSSSGEV